MPGKLQHGFYTRFGALAGGGVADPDEIEVLAAEYGTHFDDALTRALERDHKVSAAPGGLLP
jgi:hypothetical protein